MHLALFFGKFGSFQALQHCQQQAAANKLSLVDSDVDSYLNIRIFQKEPKIRPILAKLGLMPSSPERRCPCHSKQRSKVPTSWVNPDKSYYKTVVDSSAGFLGDKVPLKKSCGGHKPKSESWTMVLPSNFLYKGSPENTVSISTVPGLTRYFSLGNSSDSPIQQGSHCLEMIYYVT